MKRSRIDFKRKIHSQPRNRFEWFYKINIFKYLSFLLITLFVLSIPLVIKKIIIINKIECFSQIEDCPPDLFQKLQASNGRDYYVVKKYLSDVLNNSFNVSNYLIQYKIPSTVKIDITVKKPKFCIKYADKLFEIDKNGLVLGEVVRCDLTVINSNLSVRVGKEVDSKIKSALLVFEKVDYLYDPNNIRLLDNEFRMDINNKTVIFPYDSDIDVLVGSIRIVFSRLNDESQAIKMDEVHEIDLRFKNVVIR